MRLIKFRAAWIAFNIFAVRHLSYTGNCNVAKKSTHIIGPYSKIQTSIELPLTSPVPKSVYFRIEAWDSDYASADDLIGKFDSAEASLSKSMPFTDLLALSTTTDHNAKLTVNPTLRPITVGRMASSNVCQHILKSLSKKATRTDIIKLISSHIRDYMLPMCH
ncbi:hypothetical protein ACTXT7_000232 [Hymenolepis weldensis]